MHLLIWGHLPSAEEKHQFEYAMAEAAVPPQAVLDAIHALPWVHQLHGHSSALR